MRRNVMFMLGMLAFPLLFGPVASAAGPGSPAPSPDQARARREEIRRQQAQIAADLQPLTATDVELEKALSSVQANVRAQQAKVNDAKREADEAQRNADRLAAEQKVLQQEVDRLRTQARDRAIGTYVNPQGKNNQASMLLESSDLTQAERKREFVETIGGSSNDTADQLRSAKEKLDQTQHDFEDAAGDARAKQADLDGELKVLKDAEDQQAKVKAMVDARIAGYKQESAQLSAEDANMQKLIADAEARFRAQQEELRRQQAAAAAAQAQRAAAAQSAAPLPLVNGKSATPSAPSFTPSPGGMIWPIAPRVSQEFGVNGHPGMDLVASIGTPIMAAKAGVVISAGWNNGGYGNLVLIDHGNGIVTAYAHQSSIAVSEGQIVQQGQVIGYVGSTGNSTGPHLHFEVRVNGRVTNPRNYVG